MAVSSLLCLFLVTSVLLLPLPTSSSPFTTNTRNTRAATVPEIFARIDANNIEGPHFRQVFQLQPFHLQRTRQDLFQTNFRQFSLPAALQPRPESVPQPQTESVPKPHEHVLVPQQTGFVIPAKISVPASLHLKPVNIPQRQEGGLSASPLLRTIELPGNVDNFLEDDLANFKYQPHPEELLELKRG